MQADELLHDGQLHDLDGDGRGHHTAVAAASILDKGVTRLGHDAVGVLLAVEHAHGLSGLLEGVVVLVNNHLGHDSGTGLVDATGSELALNGLLQVVTDVTLGHGATLWEGHGRRAATIVGRVLKGQVHHAHLGTVAVTDDHVIALLDEVHDS